MRVNSESFELNLHITEFNTVSFAKNMLTLNMNTSGANELVRRIMDVISKVDYSCVRAIEGAVLYGIDCEILAEHLREYGYEVIRK